MPEGVDANSPDKAPLTPEQQTRLDKINELDSKAFSDKRGPYKTFYDQHDAEKELTELVDQLSKKTGIPNGVLIDEIKEERDLQGKVERATQESERDKATQELARLRQRRSKSYQELVRA